VAVVLVVGLAAGSVDAAVSMASGAILVGSASLSGGVRPPIPRMFVTTAVMAGVTFVGSVSGQIGWLHFGLLAPTCLVAGLLGSLGNTPAMVGNQAIIAFIVYGRFAEPGPAALELAAFVIAGGLVEIVLSVGFHWPVALKGQRQALSEAFDVLAELAASGAAGSPTTGITAGNSLDDAELALTSPVLFGHADVTALVGLLEVGRRIRVELVIVGARAADLAVAVSHGGPHHPGSRRPGGGARRGSLLVPPGPNRNLLIAVESALHGAQTALQSISNALTAGGQVDTDPLERAVPRVAAAVLHPSVASDVSGLAIALSDRVAALAGQLRAARRMLGDTRTPERRRTDVAISRPPRRDSSPLITALETLRANLSLDSTAARHALRLTVVVMVAEWLAYHTPLQRGYWVAFTAALVLRPDFAATFTRGFARVLGTIVGVGVAGLVVAASGADHITAVVLVSILIALASITFRASYAVYTMFVTGAVVLLLSFITSGAWHTAGDRLVDTCIGGALALVAYGVWPSWSEHDARRSLAQLVAAQRAYTSCVLGGAASGWAESPGSYDDTTAGLLARRTRLARVNAQSAVGRSLAEPSVHQIPGGQALLATLQRISVSIHALRSDRSDRVLALAGAVGVSDDPAGPSIAGGPPPAAGPSSAPGPSPAGGPSAAGGSSSAAGQRPGSAVSPAGSAISPAGAGPRDSPEVGEGVGPFVAAVDQALGAIEATLEEEAGPSPHLPPLRRLHDDLVDAVQRSGRDRPVLIGETDELVDAVDTLAQLLHIPA
jgi:Fusaric acid resistance protein-like/FUSC-like inner membrane protein yccS